MKEQSITQPLQTPSRDILAAATSHCAATGRPPPVKCERRDWEYSTSFALELITLKLADESSIDLVLKDLRWSALLPQAAEVRPRFLHQPEREMFSYVDVLRQANMGTPELWGSSRQDGACWLLLEHVPGDKLCHTGELDAWKDAAAWLGTFHAATDGMSRDDGVMLRHDNEYFSIWRRRLDEMCAKVSGSRAGELPSLRKAYDLATRKLIDSPNAVIHGEFYPSNVIVRRGAHRQRICPIDWELIAQGVPLLDLAALIAGGWSELERTEIIQQYRSRAPDGYDDLSSDRFEDLLNCCRLHLAVQWLTWSDEWTPPKDQAHDWFAEALGIVDQIGD